MDTIHVVILLLIFSVAVIIYKVTKLGKTETATQSTLNTNTANLSQQIVKADSDLLAKMISQRQPMFRGSRPLTTLPNTGLAYNSTWTLVPPGMTYAPFDYGLSYTSMPVTPGYNRMFKLHVNYSDTVTCPSTGCTGGGSQLEMCMNAYGSTNACPAGFAEFNYNLGLTWGGLAPYTRDWYSPLFDPTTSMPNTWAHARIMMRIDPASYNASTASGVLYSIEIEAWDVPAPLTTLPDPYCANISGSRMCLGIENNSPVCYGDPNKSGCIWGQLGCKTDQDCAQYAVGQSNNANKYGGAVANQCANANLTNPSSWPDFACLAGTTTFHP